MVQFYVATPALGFSAATLNGAAATFGAQLATATAAVNAVVGSSWTGPAADAFAEEWALFLEAAGATQVALMSVATRVQSAQASYDTVETGNSGSIRSGRITYQGPGSRGGGPAETTRQAPVTFGNQAATGTTETSTA